VRVSYMKRILLLFLALIPIPMAATPACVADKSADPPAAREIAITFDDLPSTHGDLQTMTHVTRKMLQTIKAHDIPAIGFVNEAKLYAPGQIDERTSLLRMWLDAGLELGNHSFSHISIDRAPISAYKEDVIRGETVTRMLLGEKGKKLRYYRHTQLRTGPTLEYKQALDSFLKERGYTIAPVTIDNNEYIFADAYSRAKRRGDQQAVKRIVDAYTPYMEQVFAFFEKLSAEALGYEIKQVLLLHANELNADHLEDLIQMMRRRGYRFISLEEALKDKAYSLPDAQATRGFSWIHRWMLAKGMQLKEEPREPGFITDLFNQLRRQDQVNR
jgi:peptidoglycan/xylan/chitin deacetylase (PgdA/CDA1 family)